MYSKDRLFGLTEGVYAVAITLLVIEIQAPHDASITSSSLLIEKLWSMRAYFTHWMISFYMCIYFWMLGLGLADSLKHYTKKDAFLCFLELCLVCLVPFTCSLISRHAVELAFVLFSFNLWAISAVKWCQWHRVKHSTPTPHHHTLQYHLQQIQIALISTSIFSSLSIGLAMLSPVYGVYVWLLFPITVWFSSYQHRGSLQT